MGLWTGPRTPFYRKTKRAVSIYVWFGIAAILISVYFLKDHWESASERRRLQEAAASPCAALADVCPEAGFYESSTQAQLEQWTPAAAAGDAGFLASWRGASPCERGSIVGNGNQRKTGLHLFRDDRDTTEGSAQHYKTKICVCPRSPPAEPIQTADGYVQASLYQIGGDVAAGEIFWIQTEEMEEGVWVYPGNRGTVDLGRVEAEETVGLMLPPGAVFGQTTMANEAAHGRMWESQRCANTQASVDECCALTTHNWVGGLASHPTVAYYLPDAFGCPCDAGCGGYMILHIIGFAYMCLSLAIVCDEFFVPALEVLVEKLKISPAMAGATWMAAGGSMPELFVSLFGALFEDTVGFATIVGSAVFNILFVIGFCAIFANEPLKLTWWPLFRDTLCYVTSLVMIGVFFGWANHVEYRPDAPDGTPGNYRCSAYSFLAGSKGGPDGSEPKYCTAVWWWEALILLSMYAGYCIVIKFTDQLEACVNRCIGSKAVEDSQPIKTPPSEEEGSVSRPVQIVEPSSQTFGSKDLPSRDEEDAAVELNINPRAPTLNKQNTVPINGQQTLVTTRSSGSNLTPINRDRRASEKGGQSAVNSRFGTGPGSIAESSGFRGVNFRAGISSMMTKDYSLMQLASVHMVTRIKGDVDETWAEIDHDGDGKLSMEELGALVRTLNGKGDVSETELRQCFQELDANNDGTVTQDEFKIWYLQHERKLNHDIEDVFDRLDDNDSGTLDRQEMRNLLTYINGGKEVGQEELDKAWQAMKIEVRSSEDGQTGTEGQISKAEFVQWYEHAYWFEFSANQKMQEEMEEGIQLWIWPQGWGTRITYLIHFPIMFLFYYTIPDVRKPCGRKMWPVAFIMSIVWLGLLSFVMLPWIITIGVVVGIPSFVMGFTFIAAGTSVPDLVTSVIVAKQGHGDMAVSSSLGSNIFDLLVGLPIPWLIYSAVRGSTNNAPYAVVVAEGLELSLVLLMGMLVFVIFIVAVMKWTMTKLMGGIMFLLYMVFIIIQMSVMTDWAASNC